MTNHIDLLGKPDETLERSNNFNKVMEKALNGKWDSMTDFRRLFFLMQIDRDIGRLPQRK